MLAYYWFLHILFLPTINPLPSPVKGGICRAPMTLITTGNQLPIMTCTYSPLARLFSTVYCAASGESGRERTMECIGQVNVLALELAFVGCPPIHLQHLIVTSVIKMMSYKKIKSS